MSRTYRRRGGRHDYDWVLRESCWVNGTLAIARFHSDSCWTLRSTAPRWYRRIFDHRLRTQNTKQLRRWLTDPGYDPIFQVRHRHNANWTWW